MDEQICTAIVSMLARVGVKVRSECADQGEVLCQDWRPFVRHGLLHAGLDPATYDAHNVLYTLLASRNGKRGEINDGGYSNPALDALTEKIGVETDPAKRLAMIQETIRIVQADVPVVPLHQQVIVWAAKNNVELAQPADNFFPYRFVRVK